MKLRRIVLQKWHFSTAIFVSYYRLFAKVRKKIKCIFFFRDIILRVRFFIVRDDFSRAELTWPFAMQKLMHVEKTVGSCSVVLMETSR